MAKASRVNWSTEGVFGTSAVFEGLAALAIGITFVCAIFRIKIKGDAARKCFLWLYGAMVTVFMYGNSDFDACSRLQMDRQGQRLTLDQRQPSRHDSLRHLRVPPLPG